MKRIQAITVSIIFAFWLFCCFTSCSKQPIGEAKAQPESEYYWDKIETIGREARRFENKEAVCYTFNNGREAECKWKGY